ncbi:hydroperoxide reductase [Anaeramoeba flamelloides]|uniref:Hydroperoxide reductase n=1 Tax=Anaeramoeba flamelloides TaxID=1746091 RepID=A0ABQ8Z4R2_9EUKA|nr:hydroperoxide reductase [Anaeramoeba flamelloides]
MSESQSNAENFFSDLSDETSQSQSSVNYSSYSSVNTTQSTTENTTNQSNFDKVVDLLNNTSELIKDIDPKIQKEANNNIKEISRILVTVKNEILQKTKQLKKDKGDLKQKSKKKVALLKKKVRKHKNEKQEIVKLKEELFKENNRLRKKLKDYLSEDDVVNIATDLTKNWINHINVQKIQNTLKNSQENQLIKEESIHLQWFFNKRHQFETVLFHNKGKNIIKADTPKSIGGHGSAPTPIEMITYSIGAQFTQTFVYLCSLRNLSIDGCYVESIVQTNMKRILGIEENEPLVTMVKVTLAVQTKSNQEKINEIFEQAKKICPALNFIRGTINCKSKTAHKKSGRLHQRKEKNKHILNNIYLKNVKKYHHKVKKQGIRAELKSSVVHGSWECDNALKAGQFKAIISYSKRETEIWEVDSLQDFGGTYNAPTISQLFLSGIGSCYLSQIALAASMNNVRLDELSLDCSLDVDYSKYLSKEINIESNELLKTFDNLAFNVKLASTASEKVLKLVDKQAANKCLGIYMANNSVPLSITLKINEKLDEKYLLESKKESCDIM